MRLLALVATIAAVMAVVFSFSVTAHAPSGAIFTTLGDGTEVNLNHFPSKPDVHLDGGPGPGAPKTAAGLDDGIYVFQVTDPSGAVLLSEDKAKCRQAIVADGVFTGVVDVTDGSCNEHATGLDVDHNAATIQLIPFLDTPNPGGVYKAWVVRLDDFLAGCADLGVANGLEVVDCGEQGGNRHGFVNAHSKTDNFKVDGDSVREIDVLFYKDRNGDGHRQANEEAIPNLKVFWTDTLGVRNIRYSDPNFQWGVYAHAEVPETTNGAVHTVTIDSQRGCKVGRVHLNDFDVDLDPQGNLAVNVTGNHDYLIEVACRQGR